MDDGAIKTLFLPLATGDVSTGDKAARWLFLNASLPPQDSALAKSQISAVQGMRPDFKALEAAGFAVTPKLRDGDFDGALILVSRHRPWMNSNCFSKSDCRRKTGRNGQCQPACKQTSPKGSTQRPAPSPRIRRIQHIDRRPVAFFQ